MTDSGFNIFVPAHEPDEEPPVLEENALRQRAGVRVKS
jgi:hypothetical protein